MEVKRALTLGKAAPDYHAAMTTTMGSRLRAARVVIGFSQDELADRLGVSKTAVSSWERDVDRPRVDQLPNLRRELQASLDALICGDDSSDSRVMEPGAQYATAAVARDDQERALLLLFRSLPDRQKLAILEFLRKDRP